MFAIPLTLALLSTATPAARSPAPEGDQRLAKNLPPVAKAFVDRMGGALALPAVTPQRYVWSTKGGDATGTEVDEIERGRLTIVRTAPFAEEVWIVGRKAKRRLAGKTRALRGEALRLALTRAAITSWSWTLEGGAKLEDLGRDGKGRPMVKVTPPGGAQATLFFDTEGVLQDAQLRAEGQAIDLHYQSYGELDGHYVAKIRVFLAEPEVSCEARRGANAPSGIPQEMPLVETLTKVEPLSVKR
ncbi:MAG: hypothetical protein ACYCWW_06810 [Deltaproteobacteria bacterium]